MRITVHGQSSHCLTDEAHPVFFLYKEAKISVDHLVVEVYDEDGARFWKSGHLPFSGQIVYDGIPLAPKRSYTVTVDLFNSSGLTDQGTFTLETGFMGSEWLASWIEPEQKKGVKEKEIRFHELFAPNPEFFGGHERLRPCQEVVKTFSLDSKPLSSRLYVSAHGIYSLTVNGKKISPRLFAPETSAYRDILYYQSYELNGILQSGENTLSIILADGWWIGRIGISGDSCQYGDTLAVIAQLEMQMPSGELLMIASDESFQGRRSSIDYADLFMGQRTDFLYEPGELRSCRLLNVEAENLIAQSIPPVIEYERLEADIAINRKWELIADFKKVIAGIPDIEVRSAAGTEVILDFCEVLDESGTFLRNILGRNKDQQDSFICGNGNTRFSPEFTYHGFRYMRITGITPDDIIGLSARVLGTDLEVRGTFSCSDELLNRLQENIRNSARSNFFSVPTDCPQREKAGWTGDMVAFAPTGCFNFHLDAFLTGWLENMKAEQKEDGGIPVVIPNYPMQDAHQKSTGGSTSAVWSDAAVFIPWQLYISYGDKEVLRRCMPMMEKWVNYTISQCAEIPEDIEQRSESEQRWNEYLMNTGFHFGDWFIPSFQRENRNPFEAAALTKDVVAGSYHALMLETFLKILRATGDDGHRIRTIHERLRHVRKAVSECYVSPDGRVQGDLQGLYVILLACGILTGKKKQHALERLINLIRENGTHLDTGFVSTPLLLGTLADNGEGELAMELLMTKTAPSWLYMVEQGATSIWENWEAIRPDGSAMPSSFNHYALGSVGDFLYSYIGGIRVGEAGYRKILFSPLITCGLESVQVEVESAWGIISCSYQVLDGTCTLSLNVPEGCEAALKLSGYETDLSSGEHHFTITSDGTVQKTGK